MSDVEYVVKREHGVSLYQCISSGSFDCPLTSQSLTRFMARLCFGMSTCGLSLVHRTRPDAFAEKLGQFLTLLSSTRKLLLPMFFISNSPLAPLIY